MLRSRCGIGIVYQRQPTDSMKYLYLIQTANITGFCTT